MQLALEYSAGIFIIKVIWLHNMFANQILIMQPITEINLALVVHVWGTTYISIYSKKTVRKFLFQNKKWLHVHTLTSYMFAEG